MTEIQVMGNTAIGSITKAETDVQVATAKEYPRDLAAFRKNLLMMATVDEETAKSCGYSLPRADKEITGPSVRLAELALQQFGNIRVATRLVEVGEKTLTAQAYGWDLENNTAVSTETTRRITKRNGKRYDDDMVVVTGNAAKAIALRNVVFKLIPWSLIKETYDATVQIAGGTPEQIQGRFANALTYFEKTYKVNEEALLKLVKKKSRADLTTLDIATLEGTHQALKDGTATVEGTFFSGNGGETTDAEFEEVPEEKASKEETPDPLFEGNGVQATDAEKEDAVDQKAAPLTAEAETEIPDEKGVDY